MGMRYLAARCDFEQDGRESHREALQKGNEFRTRASESTVMQVVKGSVLAWTLIADGSARGWS